MGCCRIGHGQGREALHSVGTIVSQLDGPSLCDCNCVVDGMGGEEDRDRDNQSEIFMNQTGKKTDPPHPVDLLYCPLLVW